MTSSKYKEGSGIGTYGVQYPAAYKFEYVNVENAIHRRYVIERVEVKQAGEVSRDEKGLWFKTGAGNSWLLRNRKKKDEKDTPPDLVAKIEEALKKGQTYFRIEGDATLNKEKVTVIRLEVAEPAAKSP